jgi:hypothetical protein
MKSIKYKGGIAMKSNVKRYVMALGLVCMLLAPGTAVMAAVNTATDPGGGGVALTASGNVTVNSAALQLVKQVWTIAGACLASAPADASCNTSATTATVPAGTQLKFVIFARNTTDLALSDVRIQDVIDVTGTGFTYAAGTMKHATATLDSALIATIYADANGGVIETDAADVGGTNYASYNSGLANTITIGAVVGQVNASLNVAAHTTFSLLFQATKK